MQLPERAREIRIGRWRSPDRRSVGLRSFFDPGRSLEARSAWTIGLRSRLRLVLFAATVALIVLNLDVLDRVVRLVIWVFFAPLAY